ncbi:Conidiation protein 6-domain-containing protein [Aspergillus californicus]
MNPEDRINQVRGYKAALNNPRVSEDAKQHAQSVLNNELAGDEAQGEIYAARGDLDKSPNRVAGGLKAAMHNPGVSESGKQEAKNKLGRQAPQE